MIVLLIKSHYLEAKFFIQMLFYTFMCVCWCLEFKILFMKGGKKKPKPPRSLKIICKNAAVQSSQINHCLVL